MHVLVLPLSILFCLNYSAFALAIDGKHDRIDFGFPWICWVIGFGLWHFGPISPNLIIRKNVIFDGNVMQFCRFESIGVEHKTFVKFRVF